MRGRGGDFGGSGSLGFSSRHGGGAGKRSSSFSGRGGSDRGGGRSFNSDRSGGGGGDFRQERSYSADGRGGGGGGGFRGGGGGGFRGGRGGGRGSDRSFSRGGREGGRGGRGGASRFPPRQHFDGAGMGGGGEQDNQYLDEPTADETAAATAAKQTAAAVAPSKILALGQGGTEVKLVGTSSLRYAVTCSVLTNKPVSFQLRSGGSAATALPHEAVSFLRLVGQVTSGSQFALSQAGDELKFTPGLITASGSITHDYSPPASSSSAATAVHDDAANSNAQPSSSTARAISYFIEPMLLILPFSRRPVSLTVVGPSHSPHDVCLHTVRTVTLRVAQAFGIEASLRIVRHSGSRATGCAILTVQPARKLRTAKLNDFGLISRVRGIAFGADVSPDLPQRASVAAKGVLLNFLPDIYVVTDITKREKTAVGSSAAASATTVARTSPAFGIMLVAETSTKKAVVSQETTAATREDPEEVGKRVAKLLLDEVSSAGCVDRHHQCLTLFLMGLAPDDVSTVRFGQLTPAALSALGLMAQFLNVRPVIKKDDGLGLLASSHHQQQTTGEDDDGAVSVVGVVGRGCIVRCFGSATINLTKRSG